MLAINLLMIETERDKNKFEELYNEYKWLMYYVANEFLNDKQLAEDVVHNSFVKVIPHLDKLDDVSSKSTKGYVIKVVRSVACTMYRKRKQDNLVYLEDVNSEIEMQECFEEDIVSRTEIDYIVKKIRLLPDKFRDVLLFRYIDDYTDDKIADILKISKANVRKRVERAKKMLIKTLGQRE